MDTSHEIYHLMIVDRSSSMACVRDVTIAGFNENLSGMRSDKLAEGITQKVSLVTFANDVTQDIWNKEITEIPDFNTENYKPQGSTALYDAIGSSVSDLFEQIREKLSKQDANVVVTIFTDGEENSSRTWTQAKLMSLISELRSSRMWTFTFIGCEENSLNAAKNLGFSAANTLRYDNTEKGITEAFSKLSSSRSVYNNKISSSMSFKYADASAYNAPLEDAQNDFFADDKKDNKTD